MGTVDSSGNSDARRDIVGPSKLQDQSSAGTVRETVYRHRRKLLLDAAAQAPPNFYDHGARLYDEPPHFCDVILS